MKSVLFAFIAALLIIAPAVDSGWWRSWLRALDASISLLLEDATVEEFISSSALPHRRKVALLREKLLERDQKISVALLNKESDTRQLIAAELYPVRISSEALVAVRLDTGSGELTILSNPATKGRTMAPPNPPTPADL